MTESVISEQHAKFLQRLAASQDAVWAVGRWLGKNGKEVVVPPLRFAPDASQHEAYADSGDLYVVQRKRVEVKHLRINFTGPEDWPFSEVFVAKKSGVDRSIHEVQAWVHVSHDMQYGAIITPDTQEHWYVKTVTVKNTGKIETLYVCPLKYVVFRCIGGE